MWEKGREGCIEDLKWTLVEEGRNGNWKGGGCGGMGWWALMEKEHKEWIWFHDKQWEEGRDGDHEFIGYRSRIRQFSPLIRNGGVGWMEWVMTL